ncbi:MAG: hypothetical protein ACLP9Y_18545, partial [Mycobacterium sp.]
WAGPSPATRRRGIADLSAIGAKTAGGRAGDELTVSDGVGARPLAATRLGVPPPACGGERR